MTDEEHASERYERVQIEVEDHGHTSVLASIVTTLTGAAGTQSSRFVARSPDGDDRTPPIASGTFPSGPLKTRLEDLGPRDAWADEIRARFAELVSELEADGWEEHGQGSAWWARRYRRPRADRPDA